jgi:hypothetical protein
MRPLVNLTSFSRTDSVACAELAADKPDQGPDSRHVLGRFSFMQLGWRAEGKADGGLGGELNAGGVGIVEPLIAQDRADLLQALLGISHFEWLPGQSHPIDSGCALRVVLPRGRSRPRPRPATPGQGWRSDALP